MAIDLATGFNIGSKDAIDERQVLTLEQMKNLDESIYPDKYFAICKDDGKLYLFNASNEINDETGKFREVSGSDNLVDTDNFLKSYTELSQLGLSSDVGVWEVIQALDPGAMAHIRTNGFANASTIFPITDSGVLYIVKGNDDVYLHGTQVMWTSKQGGCAIGVIGSGSFDGWNVLSGSLSSNKKLIFNNRFTIYDYTLLAKIVLPDDSIYRHNIRITCAHKINTSNNSNWTFEEDIDICKFDLHFTNPPLTAAYVDDPTIKLYGLTLYEYPFPEGTDEGIKKISENIRLYYDKTSYTIYVYLMNNENLFAGKMGRQLIGLTVENKGDIEIAESLLSDGVWNAPWNCQCEFDDLEAPTIVKVGSDAGDDSSTTTYTSLTELGLTADATFQDVVDSLPKGGSAILGVTEFTNYQTIFPYEEGNDQFGRVHIIKGTEDGSRMYARWFRKDGVKEAIAIFNINDNTFSGWRILKNQQTYTSLTELGLTADATIDDVIGALKDGETAIITTNEFTDYLTMFPNQCDNDKYAILKVEKKNSNRCFIEWRQKDGNAYAIGGLNSNNVFTNWNNLVRFKKDGYADDSIICIGDTVSSDGVIQTLANLGFSNDILTWDTGVYRVSHVSGLTGLPSDITSASPSFRLEHHDIKKWGANHNPNTQTWAQRHSIIYPEGGNVYHRFYESGATPGTYIKDTGWQKIQTSGDKVTLVANATALKLDVTKKNSSWFGAIKLTYLYDTSPAEIEISFRAATEDLRWAVINGQKYVKKITFTQDSSNTAHYTIGIEFSGTTYGCYQAEVIGGFADINSLTSEAFTGAKTAVYYSPWGKNNGVTLVSAPEDIGLTFPCTSVQLVQAMRDKFNKTINAGAIGIFNCGGKSSTITDAPSNYGLLHVETFGHDRLLIRFDGIGSSSYDGSWIGQIKGNNGAFSSITWKKIGGNDIAKTTLTFKIETAGEGSNFYFVKNGICYVNYYFVSKNAESEGAIIFENLPKPAETMNVTIGATWAEVRADSTNLYITGAMGASASCVGNFSYPVAD